MSKLTYHNVTDDARLLIDVLLEHDPETFDPEAEITRLTTFKCPECGSTNTCQPDEENLVDCYDCGIWFNPYHERNRHMLHQESEDPDTPEELKAYALQHGAGPPRRPLKHIETKADYKEFQMRFADFMRDEGIDSLSQDSDEQGNYVEGFFSWSPCECCRVPLGNTLYYASGYNPTTKEVQQYEGICWNCLYYAEYGQLDDQTMMNLKD